MLDVRQSLLVGLLIVCGVPAAAAASSACPTSFLGGEMPDFVRLAQAAPARELCYAEFAVLHSGATRTPLWAGEHLTAAQVETAEAMSRTDRFRAERRLPKGERSELADYRRSGFDRGHMAPSGNMPDASSQGDSFSLANMVLRFFQHATWSGPNIPECGDDAFPVKCTRGLQPMGGFRLSDTNHEDPGPHHRLRHACGVRLDHPRHRRGPSRST